MNESMGRLAYEGYRQCLASSGEKVMLGDATTFPLSQWLSRSEWDDLDPVQREAWEAAAQAALAERDRLHTETNVPGERAAGNSGSTWERFS